MASHSSKHSGKVAKPPRGKGKAKGAVVAPTNDQLLQTAMAVDATGVASSWATGRIETALVLAAILVAAKGVDYGVNRVVFRCKQLSGTLHQGFMWNTPGGGPVAGPAVAALAPAAPPAASQCAICWDALSCVVFGPCGHLNTCDVCAARLSECPMCRGNIESRLRTFL
jgi:hypothetical protein